MEDDSLLELSDRVCWIVHQVAGFLGGDLIGRADWLHPVHPATLEWTLTKMVSLI